MAPIDPDAHARSGAGSPGGPIQWRIIGRTLVTRRRASLPAICIFSGEPPAADAQRVSRQLSWTPWWFKLSCLIMPVVAVLTYSTLRWTGDLAFTLGPAARRRRRNALLLGAAACGLIAVALPSLAGVLEQPELASLRPHLLIIAILVAAARARPFRLIEIDWRYMYLQLTPEAASAFAAAATPAPAGDRLEDERAP